MDNLKRLRFYNVLHIYTYIDYIIGASLTIFHLYFLHVKSIKSSVLFYRIRKEKQLTSLYILRANHEYAMKRYMCTYKFIFEIITKILRLVHTPVYPIRYYEG